MATHGVDGPAHSQVNHDSFIPEGVALLFSFSRFLISPTAAVFIEELASASKYCFDSLVKHLQIPNFTFGAKGKHF